MSEQFGLFAPPPAAPRAFAQPRMKSRATWHELFFAVRPRPADATRILAQAFGEDRRLEVGGRMMDADRLHVSLFDLGGYEKHFPQQDAERWMQAADLVRIAPFEVAFDRLATFGGQANPLVLKSGDGRGVEGLQRLRTALGEKLADAGKVLKDRPVEPHMTVSYQGLRIEETSTPPVHWTAAEFVLIASHVGQHIHEVLATWPLQA